MKRLAVIAVLAVVLIAALLTLYYSSGRKPAVMEGGVHIYISSPAFANGSHIPAQYTCDGSDISPPLKWSGVPQNAKSLLVVMLDPDAPGGEFVHWVLYDVPPNATGLPQGVPKGASTPYGLQAINDFSQIGYGGPCPPPGPPHRYIIAVYALDVELAIPPGAPARQVLNAAAPHVIASGYIIGLYGR